mmetsp:Transcript_18142/g.35606  ORF Transcript_18142/g.35606 Transcript_18142/m.35606 type:complete len:95 (+) Transcript_18142:452-736(+)
MIVAGAASAHLLGLARSAFSDNPTAYYSNLVATKMLRQTNRSKNSSLQQDSHSKTPIEMESFTQRCLWKSNLFLNEIDLRQEGVRSLVFLQLEV